MDLSNPTISIDAQPQPLEERDMIMNFVRKMFVTVSITVYFVL